MPPLKTREASFKCVLLTPVLRWSILIAREKASENFMPLKAFGTECCRSVGVFLMYLPTLLSKSECYTILRESALCPLHACCSGKARQREVFVSQRKVFVPYSFTGLASDA